jgi:hypothetical protein
VDLVFIRNLQLVVRDSDVRGKVHALTHDLRYFLQFNSESEVLTSITREDPG